MRVKMTHASERRMPSFGRYLPVPASPPTMPAAKSFFTAAAHAMPSVTSAGEPVRVAAYSLSGRIAAKTTAISPRVMARS